MESTPPLFSVENLGRQAGAAQSRQDATRNEPLAGSRWLWHGVTFALHPGDCLGLVAPSGVGKTLLMRNLVLLDPIQQGEVRFEGKTPAEWGLPAYRSRVMYVPQRAIAFDGTVEANLQRAFAIQIHAQRPFDPDRIHAWLDQLGRGPEFLTLEGSRLSGGEAQILALLRALQLDPQLLLLDEPTASLDATTALKAEALLHQWLQQPNRACLLISHDGDQIDRTTTGQLYLEDFA